MPPTRRSIAAVTAIAAGALLSSLTTAPAALADGPRTPPEVRAEIQALPWPALAQGDSGAVVQAANELLQSYGYLPEQGLGNIFFDEPMADAVRAYQDDRDIPVDGRIGDETWSHIRMDFGVVGPGNRDRDKVTAVQVLLGHNGYSVADDGIYGTRTENAVIAFQEENSIDADGIVGPITFRALVTGGV
ncbi:peptidoglycan-binding domain-containing protein [Nocardiopsis suaedae]|uniref:Peptidoglycan-binding protein n=1 Tax=Nocardiopsis suaedae TaxID=3018444 RepID=A0ABT4TNF7_9ACTN|nr:peptidoglycan-binding protein [Nocardiopsis suaedae]MDA2805925.1 peptidoglycan-binding protein [Nocardiopsis suaedae]